MVRPKRIRCASKVDRVVTEVTTTEGVQAAAPPGRTTGEFGAVIFLASDVMLFAPFFAAYFLLRSNVDEWPAQGVELDIWRAAAATLVLVASSVTLLVSDRAQERGESEPTRAWLALTIGLGLVFLVNQIAEYATLPFHADDHTYGSVYWGLTGLHTAHVTAGVCAMALLYIRAVRSPSLDEVTPWGRGISLFWHLVDIVWIAVFLTIWVIR